MADFLIKLAGFIILATLAILTFGWAGTLIWKWFIMPAFHVAALKYKTAVGIGFLVKFYIFGLPDYIVKALPLWALPIASVFTSLLFTSIAGFWFLVLP